MKKIQNYVRKTRGVIKTIVQYLLVKDIYVKTHATKCLIEIGKENEKCQDVICNEGTPLLLVNMLIQSENQSHGNLLYAAIALIWILCSEKTKRRKLFVQNGAMAALNNLCNFSNERVQQASKQTLKLLQTAL